MNYTTTTTNGTGIAAILGVTLAAVLIPIIISIVITIIPLWKIYKKCDKPGWASLVPIYQWWVLFDIVDLPGWLSLLPVANIIGVIVANFRLAKVFGKDTGFGIGLLFLTIIFYYILAFSKDMPVTANGTPDVQGPNLMAPDPNDGGQVNLMTPDPVASMPDTAPAPAPTMTEQPSLDTQMNASAPDLMAAPMTDTPTEPDHSPVNPEASAFDAPAAPALAPVTDSTTPAPEMPIAQTTDAFGMSAPTPSNQTINDIAMPALATPAKVEETSVPGVETTPALSEMPAQTMDMPAPAAPASSVESTSPVNPFTTPAPTEPAQAPTAPIEPTMAAGTKKCPNCGHENAADASSCVICGTML